LPSLDWLHGKVVVTAEPVAAAAAVVDIITESFMRQ
jgi:hypothetical protein